MLNTFLSLLAYVWILQSIFTAKLSTYSLRKKIYTLWYQLIPTPPTRSSNIFLKFCYSAWSKTFLKGIYVIYSLQTTVVQFSPFCNSRLPSRLVFDNSLKNLIICPQLLMFLWYPIERLLQYPRSLKFKPNSSPYTHDYPNQG